MDVYVLQGSRSQFDPHFTWSAGKQCTAIAAAACCWFLTRGPEGWTSEMVDQCVTTGDAMYKACAHRLPAGRTHLDPGELLDVASFDEPVSYQ